MPKTNDTLYYVYWKAKATGATGHGTRAFPKRESQEYADALNKQDKDIELIHWIEPAESEAEHADS